MMPVLGHTSREPRPWFVPTLVALFFLSGACGLIYQVLWLRVLGLVFGVTVYAASAVWATYMGGLAIGSFLGGRLGDRTRWPLVWFGAAEALVGLSALLSPELLAWLQSLYAALYPTLPQSLLAVTAARGLIACVGLIVPTVLMGATLPLVVRSSLFRTDQLGSRVGLLYGTNTAGAIAGTLIAGLYLIPHLGIRHTFWAAAGTNVAVGLTAALVAAACGGVSLPVVVRAQAVADGANLDGPDLPDRLRRLVLAVFVVSGFATLALEVIWFRVIVLLVRPTVYGFSIMLATVLLGIALGSYLITPLLRRRLNWLTVLAAVEMLMGVSALFSLATLNLLPTVYRWIEPYASRVFPDYFSYPIAASLTAILPTSLLMGLAFPIGLRLWAGESSQASARGASRIGTFYSGNVCGAILGSLLAGFVLLPWLGSRSALIVIASSILASGLILFVASPGRVVARAAVTVIVGALFAVGARRTADPFAASIAVRHPNDRVLWRAEAVQATVSVHRGPSGMSLYVEGNHQASDGPSMVYVHRRIGHLPLAIHPAPARALVIGLGGGATAGAASMHQGVLVDVVELAEPVVRAAEYFQHINNALLRRPNVHLRVDDGRNYLMLTDRRYDVVTADIILPIHAGANNLYSVEYFRLVRQVLKPGGLALQWAWGTDAEHRIITRTFLDVFPHTTLWGDGSLLLGSVEPLRLSRERFDEKATWPGWREALKDLGAETFDQLLGLYLAGPDELRRYVGEGPILTDDRPLVEYFLSMPRDRQIDLSGVTGDVRRHVDWR